MYTYVRLEGGEKTSQPTSGDDYDDDDDDTRLLPRDRLNEPDDANLARRFGHFTNITHVLHSSFVVVAAHALARQAHISMLLIIVLDQHFWATKWSNLNFSSSATKLSYFVLIPCLFGYSHCRRNNVERDFRRVAK